MYPRISKVLLSESSNNEDYQMPEYSNCCDAVTFAILKIPSTCVHIFHNNLFGGFYAINSIIILILPQMMHLLTYICCEDLCLHAFMPSCLHAFMPDDADSY
ncbi:hypothetical protein PS15p_202098 [Mucor circinelloides]